MQARAGLDQHRAVGRQHHLGVGRAVLDPERVEHVLHVRHDEVLLRAAVGEQLLEVVSEVALDADLRVAPDLGDVMDAVPRDRVAEQLRAAQQLLHEQLLVRALERVGAAEHVGEGRADRVGVLAQRDAVGPGRVERLDDDRPVAALLGPGDRLLDVAGLQLLHGAQAGGAHGGGHLGLVAASAALGGAVGGQAERLAQRVAQQHARLGADDDEGRVVSGDGSGGRGEVALVDDVLEEVLRPQALDVERRLVRVALDVDDVEPLGDEAGRQSGAGRVGVDDDRDASVVTHAVATRTRRSSGCLGWPSKPP